MRQLGSTSARENELVGRQGQDRKVKRHCVYEGCCKHLRIRLRDDASRGFHPGGANEQAVKQEGPVAEDDKNEQSDDVDGLRPYRNADADI